MKLYEEEEEEEEEQVWKCSKHPSKRRRFGGVCPHCLTIRLAALCPNCATLLPCSCSSSSSSTASSSFNGCTFARISTLIDDEPPYLRRTRSSASAFSFFRSSAPPPEKARKSTSSMMLSVLRWRSSRREKVMPSKSVASVGGGDGVIITSPVTVTVTAEKGKGWNFPSPMKVFRHSKTSKVAHQRSPLHRG